MSKVTIDDVADLAGVSIKTVSRVVNREPNVRDTTRLRVEQAITRLNYRPNISARNLASLRSHLIVLVYDDPSAYETPSGGYVISMQQGTLAACRAANYELLIHPCNYRSRDVKGDLTGLIERTRPDGIVIAAPLSNMPRVVDPIAETGTPFVRLSPGARTSGEFAVATNDRDIAADMTRHLASEGHRRIAFIKGHPKHKAVGNRFRGYRDALKELGIGYVDDLVASGDNSIGSGEAAADALLHLEVPPTAIFAANDDMAAGVIRVANRLGVRVPTELSVAGFDDSSLAQQIFPALTTVRQPLLEMAERAASVLIDGRKDVAADSTIEVIPSQLELRDSTGPAPW